MKKPTRAKPENQQILTLILERQDVLTLKHISKQCERSMSGVARILLREAVTNAEHLRSLLGSVITLEGETVPKPAKTAPVPAKTPAQKPDDLGLLSEWDE